MFVFLVGSYIKTTKIWIWYNFLTEWDIVRIHCKHLNQWPYKVTLNISTLVKQGNFFQAFIGVYQIPQQTKIVTTMETFEYELWQWKLTNTTQELSRHNVLQTNDLLGEAITINLNALTKLQQLIVLHYRYKKGEGWETLRKQH